MKRIMGIDYGTARIGIALSDELQMLAHPTETIALAKVADPVTRIAALVSEKNVELIVVGLPRHMNGAVGVSADQASDFAEKLKAKVKCDVRTWDERLSTMAAQRALREAGKSVRQSRGYIDQVAAQMLLQSYLDSLQLNQGGLEPSPFA
jgi:putative holliday junction resolvase